MKTLKILAISALMGLIACATEGPAGVTRLGADPVLTGGTYSTGGGITVASELREIDGRTGLCGVWSESRSQVAYTKNKARAVLASGSAYLGDEKLLTGLAFMRRAAPSTDYAGAPANCIATARVWQPGDASRAPVIRLPRQAVYRNVGNVGGQIIEFRQTGPGALSGSLNLVQALFGYTVRLPLGPRPVLGGGRYSSGGGISVAAELRNVGGVAHVCGVWAESRVQLPRTEKQAPEVLARGAALVGGRTLIQDFRFMRRVSPRKSLAGRSATCASTGQPWAGIGGEPLRLHLTRQVIYSGPGTPVYFEPTGPGA